MASLATHKQFYLVSFQTMRDLSLDDERIMSGYLGLVVIWVTQPLWPRSVPRSCRVSVILPLLSFSARFKRVSPWGVSSENCASKTQSNLAFNTGGGQEHNLILLGVLLSTTDPTSPPRSNKTNLFRRLTIKSSKSIDITFFPEEAPRLTVEALPIC